MSNLANLGPNDSLATSESLAPAELARVNEVAERINLADPSLSITYGTETMSDIARFADSMLSQVKAKDAGPIADTLTELMLQVKDIDVSKMQSDDSGFLQKIPLLGNLFNSAQRSIAKFNTVAGQVEIISSKLEETMVGLIRDIEMLEQLYGHNRKFHQELSVYIEAGKKKLEEARNVELPKLKAEAEASSDSMLAQNVRDLAEQMNRFERRLHDLQLSRTITLQTAPQIRLIQSNDQTLAEKIQTSILATIPIWKSQMVLALSLHRQSKAVKLQKQVSDTTNDLLKKNADMLHSATVETAKEVERSIVDIETIREVHGKLISTIEETLRIAQEGREKRASVEKELGVMEHELREKLTSLAINKNQQSLENAEGKNLPIEEKTN